MMALANENSWLALSNKPVSNNIYVCFNMALNIHEHCIAILHAQGLENFFFVYHSLLEAKRGYSD